MRKSQRRLNEISCADVAQQVDFLDQDTSNLTAIQLKRKARKALVNCSPSVILYKLFLEGKNNFLSFVRFYDNDEIPRKTVFSIFSNTHIVSS